MPTANKECYYLSHNYLVLNNLLVNSFI